MAGLCVQALSSSCPPLGRASTLWLGFVAVLCGWALSSSWPPPELCQLCGWALGSVAGPCPPLVLLLAAPLNPVNSVAGLCGSALSSLGRAPELCQLCGWALWLGLVLLLAAPLKVAGLCGWALSSSCPALGRAPELCQPCGWALWLGLVLLLFSSWPRPSTLSTLWLGFVAVLCGWAFSSSCPPLGRAPELCQLCGSPLVLLLAALQLCGWALCPGLVLLLTLWLGSVSRPCPSSWPRRALWLGLALCCPSLGRAPELCQLCGGAAGLGSASCPPLGRAPQLSGLVLLLSAPGSVSRPCPPVVLLLAAPLNSVNSVAGLCGRALSSSWPRP